MLGLPGLAHTTRQERSFCMNCTQSSSRSRANQGFVLLETMLAMALLASAMLVLFGVLLNGGVLAATVRDRHRALQDVYALMEQMQRIPIASIRTTLPHDTDIPEFNDLHVRQQRMRIVYDAAPEVRPMSFRVRCTWQTLNGRPGVVEVAGLRAR